jgi:hypothetical protein
MSDVPTSNNPKKAGRKPKPKDTESAVATLIPQVRDIILEATKACAIATKKAKAETESASKAKLWASAGRNQRENIQALWKLLSELEGRGEDTPEALDTDIDLED